MSSTTSPRPFSKAGLARIRIATPATTKQEIAGLLRRLLAPATTVDENITTVRVAQVELIKSGWGIELDFDRSMSARRQAPVPSLTPEIAARIRMSLNTGRAAAEPETVLMYLSDQESELKYRGYQAGDHSLHDLLRQYSPGWALARPWAGFEYEVEQLKKEIGRLRELITRAAYELRDAGADQKSRRLLRALDGG